MSPGMFSSQEIKSDLKMLNFNIGFYQSLDMFEKIIMRWIVPCTFVHPTPVRELCSHCLSLL